MSKNGYQIKMTKAEIVENIHNGDLGITRQNIHGVIISFLEEIKKALSDDRVVELRGFGTFEIRTRKGRERARNPKTGELVPVKTHGVTFFRPGKELKKITWDLRGQK